MFNVPTTEHNYFCKPASFQQRRSKAPSKSTATLPFTSSNEEILLSRKTKLIPPPSSSEDPSELTTQRHPEFTSSDEKILFSRKNKSIPPAIMSREDTRYHRICPIEGCKAKPQKKLSNHLRSEVHKDLTEEEIKKALKVAIRLPRRKPGQAYTRPVKGQLTLEQILHLAKEDKEDQTRDDHINPARDDHFDQTSDRKEELESSRGDLQRGTTRHFARFDVDTQDQFLELREWLQSVDGRSRSAKVAKEIATDISKYLKFACPTKERADWSELLNRTLLLKYLKKVESSGCGPEGQLTKLDAISIALSFVKLHICEEDSNEALFTQCIRMDETIHAWKRTIRVQRRKKAEARIEDLSATPLSLDEVSAVVECERMWADLQQTVEKLETGENVSEVAINRSTISVAGLLMYKSWVRPGAVCNCTLEEYEQVKVVKEKGEDVFVIRVKEHKTGIAGSAKLVMCEEDYDKLNQYVEAIRPHADQSGKCPYLFVLCGSKQLKNLQGLLNKLGKYYGFTTPTATRVRKIGATSVCNAFGDGPEKTRVSKQMSHSMQTHSRYYEATRGAKNAAQAFQTMEKLRTGSTKETKKGETSSVKKRHRFSAEDEKLVREFFQPAIAQKATPSIGLCGEFLKEHTMDRTPQQIQDKVKSIIKYL